MPDDALPVTDNPLAPLAKTHPLPTVATVPLHSSGPAMPSLQPLLPVARSTSSAASSAPLPMPVTTISPPPTHQSLPLLDDRAFYLLRGGSVTMPAVARNVTISPVSKLTPAMPAPSPPVPLPLPSRTPLLQPPPMPDGSLPPTSDDPFSVSRGGLVLALTAHVAPAHVPLL